jgi:hypothetical protein
MRHQNLSSGMLIRCVFGTPLTSFNLPVGRQGREVSDTTKEAFVRAPSSGNAPSKLVVGNADDSPQVAQT